MANASANIGEVQLLINNVQVGKTLYIDASSSWVRAGSGLVYSMPASTTYAIKLQAKISGGSTFSVTNESNVWKPTITGVAIPVGVV